MFFFFFCLFASLPNAALSSRSSACSPEAHLNHLPEPQSCTPSVPCATPVCWRVLFQRHYPGVWCMYSCSPIMHCYRSRRLRNGVTIIVAYGQKHPKIGLHSRPDYQFSEHQFWLKVEMWAVQHRWSLMLWSQFPSFRKRTSKGASVFLWPSGAILTFCTRLSPRQAGQFWCNRLAEISPLNDRCYPGAMGDCILEPLVQHIVFGIIRPGFWTS
jgi:hypothetical protein